MPLTDNSRLRGIWLMLGSACGFSIMALCVKMAAGQLPSFEIVFFRSLIGTLMLLAVMLPNKTPLVGWHIQLLTFRGLSGFIALALHFYAITKLPLGTAVMLNYTSPIIGAVLAVFFLKEKPGLLLSAMTLVAFLGVWILVGGTLKEWNLPAILGFLSAFFAAAAYILIRTIKHRESPMTIMFYFTALSTVGSLLFLPFGFVWPIAKTWFLLIGVGIGSFYGQLWMTMAFQTAPATLVSPFFFLTPVLSFLYGLVIFHDPFSSQALLGVILIITSGSLISIWETRQDDTSLPNE